MVTFIQIYIPRNNTLKVFLQNSLGVFIVQYISRYVCSNQSFTNTTKQKELLSQEVCASCVSQVGPEIHGTHIVVVFFFQLHGHLHMYVLDPFSRTETVRTSVLTTTTRHQIPEDDFLHVSSMVLRI
jgi:hypothetical protein